MFNLHDFIFKGIIKMIGKEADYKVIQYSAGWYAKDVLEDSDMAYIDRKIEEYNAANAE